MELIVQVSRNVMNFHFRNQLNFGVVLRYYTIDSKMTERHIIL